MDDITLKMRISTRTFAYVTLKERMPRVLTQVIDTIHREEKTLCSQYGEVSNVLSIVALEITVICVAIMQ